MKNTFVVFITFCLVSILSAQNVAWVKTAGGAFNDAASAIAVDNAGDIVIAGYASKELNFDGNQLYDSTNYSFVAKFDLSGNNLWNVKIKPNNQSSGVIAMQTDNNNNIYVVGYTIPAIYPYLVKFDESGSLIWQKQIQTFNELVGLDIDKNGNVYFWCNSVFQKISPSGSVLHEMKFTYPSSVNFVRVFESNNYLFSGRYLDSLMVTDAKGNDITLHHDSNIINGQSYFIKFDSAGGFLWSDNYHDGDWGIRNCVVDNEDESFYLLGVKDSSYLERFSSAGLKLWSKKQYAGNQIDCYWSPQNLILKNNHIFVTGGRFSVSQVNPPITRGCLNVLKIDTSGNVKDIISAQNDSLFFVMGMDSYIHGNSLLVTGGVSGSGSWSGVPLASQNLRMDVMLARIDATDFILSSNAPDPVQGPVFSIFPNPSSNQIYVKISDKIDTRRIAIYSITGNKVFEDELSQEKINSIDISSFSAGYYIVRLQTSDGVQSSRFCVVK